MAGSGPARASRSSSPGPRTLPGVSPACTSAGRDFKNTRVNIKEKSRVRDEDDNDIIEDTSSRKRDIILKELNTSSTIFKSDFIIALLRSGGK